MVMKAIVLAALCLAQSAATAQFGYDTAAYSANYDQGYLRFQNHIYTPAVRTVQLHPEGWPTGPAIIELMGDNTLLLSFDVLDSVMGNFSYRIKHCTAEWLPSDLDYHEYAQGQTDDFLSEYAYARNTFQRYVHYELTIPNEAITLTRSGNYLLSVFESGKPENLLLTQRFVLFENLVDLATEVHQPLQVKYRNTHQEIDFTATATNYDLASPYAAVKAVVLQNHNWTTAITTLKPRFVKANELDYNQEIENLFPALNEFRLIDIQNTRFNGQGIARVNVKFPHNDAYTELNRSRAQTPYLQRNDLNGWYFLKTTNVGGDARVDADYVRVHFTLKPEALSEPCAVYVFGALSQWQLKPEFKLNPTADGMLSNSVLLKQGLYNYVFVRVCDEQLSSSATGTGGFDATYYEGSHFATENEYDVLLYHKQIGLNYDRVIGYKHVKFPASP